MEPGGEVLLAKECRALAESCTVGWKVELTSDELGYLTEESPSRVLKVPPGFSLLLGVKRKRRKINWRRTC